MGRFVPNDLLTGKKADIRAQIDLTKEVSQCGTVEVGLQCTGDERGRLSGPVLLFFA